MAKKAVKAAKAAKRRPARTRPHDEDPENRTTSGEENGEETTDEEDDDETPGDEARSTRDEVRQDRVQARRKALDAQVEKLSEEATGDVPDEDEVTLHDGKPGSGAGLKPGDWHAPRSNPGAAARVPSQPLQPESLQSHGLGILHDKDLDNGAFGGDDPEAVDEGPSGSNPNVVDKKAERKKAERFSGRAKQMDPDNPTVGAGGRKDATASPNPIGTRTAGKADVAGGSNSGIDS